MFFYQNPLYYDFLFSRKNIKVTLSLDTAVENENQPFEILRKAAVQAFGKVNMPPKMMQDKIIAMWALVQGLSTIVTMPDIEYDDNWEMRIEEIITSISIPYHEAQEKNG